jgi:purine-cytosine permease-like protein
VPLSRPLVAAVLRARRSAGRPEATGDGSTDANAALAAGIPAVALGCCEGEDMHAPTERIRADTIAGGAARPPRRRRAGGGRADQRAELHTLTGGIGWLVMIVFALGIMDTNSINLYGGVLCSITTGQTFARTWIPGARVRAILSVAIVGLSLILATGLQSNFLTNYTNFILLLLYVLIPWTAINLVDYYLIRHGEYDVEAFFDPSGGPYGRVGGIGIAAYIVGIAVEIPFMSTELYTGPAASAMNGTDLSWIVGLVVTVPLYYLLAVRQRARRPAAVPQPARN